jgi:hypothetical protein
MCLRTCPSCAKSETLVCVFMGEGCKEMLFNCPVKTLCSRRMCRECGGVKRGQNAATSPVCTECHMKIHGIVRPTYEEPHISDIQDVVYIK